MKTICRTGYVTIPEGITITIKAKVVTVKGRAARWSRT